MIVMLGNKVNLIRYIIKWERVRNRSSIEMVEECISEDHKMEVVSYLENKGIEFDITEVNQNGNEWLEGLEFPSREDAITALDMGEVAWKEYKFSVDSELQTVTMLLDLDYRLGLIEMGVM